MLPTFPDFKKVELSDRAAVESYTHRYAPYSDFNFTSLWVWDTDGERMLSDLNGNLVVRFTDYTTLEPFFSFLGTNKSAETALQLIDHTKNLGLAPMLRLVPEESVEAIRARASFIVEEDADNFDYILSVQQLALLRGGQWKEKRHLAARFIREHQEAHFKTINLQDVAIQKAISSLLDVWEERKKLENEKHALQYERIAIGRLFEISDLSGIFATGIFVNDTLIGFSVDETLSNSYGVSHFFKTDHAYVGAPEFLNTNLAQRLVLNDINWWNWEQDLGIQGLRRSKTSYHPTLFLKKYKISPAYK